MILRTDAKLMDLDSLEPTTMVSAWFMLNEKEYVSYMGPVSRIPEFQERYAPGSRALRQCFGAKFFRLAKQIGSVSAE